MPAAFVTGATGFLGLNVVDALQRAGWTVIANHRGGADLTWLRAYDVDTAVADVTDQRTLEAVFPDRVDAVFHLAGKASFWAPTHPDQWRVHVLGTRHVAQAALRRGARLILTSSAGAFGLQPGVVTESSPWLGLASPLPYIRTKAQSEEEARALIGAGLDVVILNPSTTIGRYDTRQWLGPFRQIAAGKLRGLSPGRSSFAHARHVAEAHVAAAEQGRRSERYLLGGPTATFLEAAQIIADLVSAPRPTKVTSPAALRAAGFAAEQWARLSKRKPIITTELAEYLINRNVVSSDKATAELGYEPPPLQEVLGDYHRWLRCAGLLA